MQVLLAARSARALPLPFAEETRWGAYYNRHAVELLLEFISQIRSPQDTMSASNGWQESLGGERPVFSTGFSASAQ